MNDRGDDTVSLTKTQSFRWQISPGTFLGIISLIGLFGMVVETCIIVYYNAKYGWIQVDPANPSLSRLAITPLNVLIWQCGCWGIISAGISTYAWFTRRWRLAWITLILFFGLMFTSNWLQSLYVAHFLGESRICCIRSASGGESFAGLLADH